MSDLPNNWKRYYNEEHKQYYYHNEITDETTWQKPLLKSESRRHTSLQMNEGVGDNNAQRNHSNKYNGVESTGKYMNQQRPREYHSKQSDTMEHQYNYQNKYSIKMSRTFNETEAKPDVSNLRQPDQRYKHHKNSSSSNTHNRYSPEGNKNDQNTTLMHKRKLYVSSLKFETTSSDLKSYFGRIGLVEDTNIVYFKDNPSKSRGFGFVTYVSPDHAKEAVQKYDRKGFQGRIIRVEYAAESQNAPRDNFRQSNYPVSQKPNYFSHNMDDRMNNMMDQGRSGGMGVRDRNHRVNRLSIPNHRLSSSGGRTGIGGVGSGDGTLIQMRNECTVFVGQLNFRTNSTSLGKAFERLNIGRVRSAKVVYFPHDPSKSKGFGFVEFEHPGSVQKAIDKMNGRNLDGREVIVKVRTFSSHNRPESHSKDTRNNYNSVNHNRKRVFSNSDSSSLDKSSSKKPRVESKES